MSNDGVEFAFSLPLGWPDGADAKQEYERELIAYAATMKPIVLAAEGELRQILLDAISSTAKDMAGLWASQEMPVAIVEFLAIIDQINGQRSESR